MNIRLHLSDLLPFYLLDAISDQERTWVEDHIHQHPEMHDDLVMLASDVLSIHLAIPRIQPSGVVFENLLTRIEQDGGASSSGDCSAEFERTVQNTYATAA